MQPRRSGAAKAHAARPVPRVGLRPLPVAVGLARLGEQEQGGRVRGLRGAGEVEQDEGVRVQRRPTATALTAIQAATTSVCATRKAGVPTMAQSDTRSATAGREGGSDQALSLIHI